MRHGVEASSTARRAAIAAAWVSVCKKHRHEWPTSTSCVRDCWWFMRARDHGVSANVLVVMTCGQCVVHHCRAAARACAPARIKSRWASVTMSGRWALARAPHKNCLSYGSPVVVLLCA